MCYSFSCSTIFLITSLILNGSKPPASYKTDSIFWRSKRRLYRYPAHPNISTISFLNMTLVVRIFSSMISLNWASLAASFYCLRSLSIKRAFKVLMPTVCERKKDAYSSQPNLFHFARSLTCSLAKVIFFSRAGTRRL